MALYYGTLELPSPQVADAEGLGECAVEMLPGKIDAIIQGR